VEEACEILGFDPLYLANEGKLVAFVAPEVTDEVLASLQAFDCGRRSAVIGEVIKRGEARVTLITSVGGRRTLDVPIGTQLPRIC
jgi:hydrogenase expression/formation protein HypE